MKKKGGREMNPADAYRKTQRAKEIARNKKERKFQRDAHALQSQPDAIKAELESVFNKEEEGRVPNQTLRLKKVALERAYEAALKKKKEGEVRMLTNGEEGAYVIDPGLGGSHQPVEDSVYWHPTLNPQGLPPPGKPQRYKAQTVALEGPLAAGGGRAQAGPPGTHLALPMPAPPPLPSGPAPGGAERPLLPPPPKAPLPAGPAPGSAVLPPPVGPPPGMAAKPLPPPEGPPPGMSNGGQGEGSMEGAASQAKPLPPPVGPPPGLALPSGPPPGRLAPPPGPPPGFAGRLPPPMMPPPGFRTPMPPPAGAPPGAKKDANPTVMGQSTVIKMPRATDDKTVTAMVPASLRVRRDQNAMRLRAVGRPGVAVAAGFGLLPALEKPAPAAAPKPAVPAETDKKYQDFLAEMSALGALA